MAIFKQKCMKCKKNYVLVTNRQREILCYECQKPEMNHTIKNPEMKKLFNIPEEYYKQNAFLRNIKIHYIRFKTLTERQKEAFKETVERIKNPNTQKSQNIGMKNRTSKKK